MNDKKTEGKNSKKNKVVLALIVVFVLVFGGYHLNILFEAYYYGTTYTHMKKIKKGNDMWERIAKENLLNDKDKTF